MSPENWFWQRLGGLELFSFNLYETFLFHKNNFPVPPPVFEIWPKLCLNVGSWNVKHGKAFGAGGRPVCKKEVLFYLETNAAASRYQCLLMPYLDQTRMQG